MKKLTLSVALLASVLAMKAQDTICTMVRPHEVIEFNYQTDKVVSRYDNKGTAFIEVGYQEVLCLHLMDEKSRIRKVIMTFADGDTITQILDSKDDTYFSPLGVVKVEVRKPKFMIKL